MRKRDLSLEKRSGAKPRLPVIEDDVEIGAGSAIATHAVIKQFMKIVGYAVMGGRSIRESPRSV